MFKVQPYEFIDAEPWREDLEGRLKKLDRYKSMGFQTVVYVAEWGDQSTFRYRAYNMVQALYGSAKWKGIYIYKAELDRAQEYLNRIDCLVLVRYRWDLQLNHFLQEARKREIPVVYDVDDYIFDIQALESLLKAQGILNPTEQEIQSWHLFVSRIYQAASICDVCMTTNYYLAGLIEKVIHKKCYVIDNFFNYWQYEASNYYYEQKKEYMNQEPRFCLGYFSGSNTHREDLNLAIRDLYEAFCAFPEWQLMIVGYMETEGYLQKLKEENRITFIPIQNYIDLQKYIAEVDVNLIPLVNSEFANSKSELKYFEAGIVGTISCASPTFVYQNCIENGVNGFLCEEKDWFSTVSALYKKGIDGSVVESARNKSIERYAYFNQLNHIEEVLDCILKGEIK